MPAEVWEIPHDWDGRYTSVPRDVRLSNHAIGRICLSPQFSRCMLRHFQLDFTKNGMIRMLRKSCGLPFLDSAGRAMRIHNYVLGGANHVRAGLFTEHNWREMDYTQEWRTNLGFKVENVSLPHVENMVDIGQKRKERVHDDDCRDAVMNKKESLQRTMDEKDAPIALKDNDNDRKSFKIEVAHDPHYHAVVARKILADRREWVKSQVAGIGNEDGSGNSAIAVADADASLDWLFKADTTSAVGEENAHLKVELRSMEDRLEKMERELDIKEEELVSTARELMFMEAENKETEEELEAMRSQVQAQADSADQREVEFKAACNIAHGLTENFLRDFQCESRHLGDKAAAFAKNSSESRRECQS